MDNTLIFTNLSNIHDVLFHSTVKGMLMLTIKTKFNFSK